MRIVFLLTLLLVVTPFSDIFAAELVKWESPEGIKRLERSEAKADFFVLANHFESQENKVYCGLASSAMVLNALKLGNTKISKPLDDSLSKEERRYLPAGFNPIFERYTQENVLNSRTKSKMEILGKPVVINGKSVADFGLQLKQLATVLQSNDVDITARVANDAVPDETIRKELIANMQNPGDYVLVNYSRKALQQEGSGHISPLGAYDKKSDSFLILDVNPNAAGWVWVSAADLIASMRTFDTVENRGYVLVHKRKAL
ncbi:MAG: hypothetical protein K0R63_533 [Rickettsiales bacterium]|jgi:hypothetical protein|nr:hypothetical protein [Rickettsiales bacterium]